jgi:RHS repeat-associated protein
MSLTSHSLSGHKQKLAVAICLTACVAMLLVFCSIGHTAVETRASASVITANAKKPEQAPLNPRSILAFLRGGSEEGRFKQLFPLVFDANQAQQTDAVTTGLSLSMNQPSAGGVSAQQNLKVTSAALNFGRSSLGLFHSITVEAWVNPQPGDGGRKRIIVSRYETVSTGKVGYLLQLTEQDKVKFSLFADDPAAPSGSSIVTSDIAISPGTGPFNGWHHIAGVFKLDDLSGAGSAAGKLNVYVDGVKNNTAVNSIGADDTSSGVFMRIGRDNEDPPSFYSGLIDEVRITDGAVYSQNFTPARNLTVLLPSQTGMRTVGLWKFDDNTSLTALGADATGNATVIDVRGTPPPSASTDVPPPAPPGPNTAPQVSITGTTPAPPFNEPADVRVNAVASDPDADDGISSVQFKRNNVPVGNPITEPPYRLQLNGLAAGNYSMTAVATDGHGSSTESSPFNITVNGMDGNLPPSITVTGTTPSGPFTAPASMRINAIASDPDEEAIRVQFFKDGQPFGSPVTSPPFNSVMLSGLGAGTYEFKAVVTDAHENSSTSNLLSVNVNPGANTPPTVNFVKPTNSQIFRTSPINLDIQVTASDPDGINQVVFFGDNDPTPLCTLPGGQSSYSCRWKRVGQGSHIIRAQATDGQGVPGSAQINVTVEGRRTPNDFDLDGMSDMTIWRPSDLYWYVNTSSPSDFIRKAFGIENDVLVPADYDGDRKTDFAVWRIEGGRGLWYVENSSNASISVTEWGNPGDIPVPADYDGDGKANLTVWRQGAFLVRTPSGVGNFPIYLGGSGDLPVPADYDGDGKTDAAIWRASDETWYIIASSNGSLLMRNFGIAFDYLAPADYDGDGEADVALWRVQNDDKGIFYVDMSSTTSAPDIVKEMGNRGDIPVPGDYDGDGKNDLAVYRPSTGRWQINRSSSPSTTTEFFWGVAGDVVPAKYAQVNNPPPPSSTNAKPTVNVSSPSAGQMFPVSPANIPIIASASDSDGTISKVEFFGDSNPTPFATDTDGPSYDATWSGVPQGPHSISVKATDNLGDSTTVQVNITVGGTTPPGPTNPPEAPDLHVNQIGRLTSVGNNATGSGSIRIFYGYDNLGRSTGTVHVLAGTSYINRTSYGYPQNNDQTSGFGTVALSQTFPDSEKVAYTYDMSGAQQSIKTTPFGGPERTIISSVKRNPRGQTVEVSYGDGTISTHTYNETTNLFLKQITTTLGSSPIQDYVYGFDNNGNVTAVTDNRDHSLDATYTYDSLDQLTQMKVTQTGTSLAYEYSALGNLRKKDGLIQTYGGTQSCPVCPAARGPHALATAQGVTYNYDANGNMVGTTGGSETIAITWNAENMPTHIVKGNVVMDKFYLGETLWKKVEAGRVTYYLPSARVENGHLRKFFADFAERSPNDGSPGNDGKLKFYHNDHLGSASLVTSESGTVLRKQSYMPYGEDRAVNPNNFDPKYQFNFKEKEASGFYDYGARLYNPATGRWLSADTSTDDGLNRYAYVRNNPLLYVDPTGHQARRNYYNRALQEAREIFRKASQTKGVGIFARGINADNTDRGLGPDQVSRALDIPSLAQVPNSNGLWGATWYHDDERAVNTFLATVAAAKQAGFTESEIELVAHSNGLQTLLGGIDALGGSFRTGRVVLFAPNGRISDIEDLVKMTGNARINIILADQDIGAKAGKVPYAHSIYEYFKDKYDDRVNVYQVDTGHYITDMANAYAAGKYRRYVPPPTCCDSNGKPFPR